MRPILASTSYSLVSEMEEETRAKVRESNPLREMTIRLRRRWDRAREGPVSEARQTGRVLWEGAEEGRG